MSKWEIIWKRSSAKVLKIPIFCQMTNMAHFYELGGWRKFTSELFFTPSSAVVTVFSLPAVIASQTPNPTCDL